MMVLMKGKGEGVLAKCYRNFKSFILLYVLQVAPHKRWARSANLSLAEYINANYKVASQPR